MELEERRHEALYATVEAALEPDACRLAPEAARLDFDFHMRIVSIAGNAAIESILRSSSDIMKESQRMPFFRRELVLSTYHEHRTILDALKTRDSAAAGKAIETHITNAAQRAGVYFPVPKA